MKLHRFTRKIAQRSKAFTLTETLVVIAVIVLLAGLLMPVLGQVRQKAKMSNSMSNLHQLYLGLSMYREESGIAAEYGTAAAMGLPSNLMISPVHRLVASDEHLWRSPCCCHKDAPTGRPDYRRYVSDYAEYFHDDDLWPSYTEKYMGSSMLLVDFHCNSEDVDLYQPMGKTITGLGVRLDGASVVKVRATTISNFKQFWNQ
jgi:type II secretory pathway pseudopilin PulG